MVGHKGDVAVTADRAWSVTATPEDGARLDAERIRGEGKAAVREDSAAEAARAPFMTCLACGVNVITGRPDRRYCSGRCRARASRERKTREIDALITRLQAEAQSK
jgi:hypothetical protein